LIGAAERSGLAEGIFDDMGCVAKRKDPEQVFSGSIFLTPSSISFHGLSLRSPYSFFSMLAVHVLQHGAGGLRATAAVFAIELIDAQGVRADDVDKDYSLRVFVDRVHHAEHSRFLFRPA
jgi:hypothetical protein